jgi:transposase
MGTFEALSNYRLRGRIEDGYGDHKGSLGGSRPHTWFPDNLKGKLFVQFIALGYLSFLQKKVKEVKESLAKNQNEMTKEQYTKEEKLSHWLKDHSLLQIMDWFDCIETTTVQTANSKIRWSTESVSRDKLFLEKLGVLTK